MTPDDMLDQALERHRAGRLADAIALYLAILEIDDGHAGAWLNLGAAHRQSGALKDAVAALRRAALLAPEHPGVLFNLGNALAESGALDEAERYLRAATAVDPEFAEAFNNLADVLMRREEDAAALEVLRTGLRISPDHVGMLINRGNAEHRLGHGTEAMAHLRRALELSPGITRAWRNLGNVLRTSGQLAAAEEALRAGLMHDPNDAEAHCLLALTLLADGRFDAGWREYRWRWRSTAHEPARPFHDCWPEWEGDDIAGKRLLVWGEQAVGDEMMFAGVLRDLLARGAEVTLETEYRLCPLFARSFPDCRVVARRTPPDVALLETAFDAQIALGDLAGLLRPDVEAFGDGAAYLCADPALVERFRLSYARLAGSRRRVGITWRSGAEQAGTPRSVPLDDLAVLLGRRDCWFVNLQYGDVSDDLAGLQARHGVTVHDDASVDQMTDLDRFAAQVAGLDLVVSAANTAVHMAGALGVPALVMVSEQGDWRWLLDRPTSPWYGAVTLYRQAGGGWSDVIARINAALG